MSRTTRAFIAFAFGAAVVFTGLVLGAYVGDVQRAVHQATRHYLNPDALQAAATAFVLGGLVIEGLALHAWATAGRDDR
jgi:hypothetical protein